jgi:hypothetical protein
MSILGNYVIEWADTAHTGTGRRHQLELPPQRLRPSIRGNTHRAVSLDFTVQETISLGTAHELMFQVRAERNSRSLADLAEAGITGNTLTVRDLAEPQRNVDVYLVDPYDLWLSVFDPDSRYREWQTEIAVRRTNGTAFPDWLLYATFGTEGVLLKYAAGMDLSGTTHTRTTAGVYLTADSTLASAATNVARDGNHVMVSGAWTPTLLLRHERRRE